MPTLVICRGLPGSGKSTYAENQALMPDWMRSNRDDLRKSMFGRHGVLDYKAETIITAAQHAAVRDALTKGLNVVVDDTHLQGRYIRAWIELANDLGCSWEVKDFTVPIDECVRRDAARDRSVGEDVIRKLAVRFHMPADGTLPSLALLDDTRVGPTTRYEADPSLPPAYIVDIDGTLARMTGREPYDYTRVSEDELVQNVATIVSDLCENTIIVMSGRDASCEADTRAWLTKHHVPFDHLFMRPAGDSRPDQIIKRELFDEHIRGKFNVVAVLDDRNKVVRMWREMGLTCLQVAPGAF